MKQLFTVITSFFLLGSGQLLATEQEPQPTQPPESIVVEDMNPLDNDDELCWVAPEWRD